MKTKFFKKILILPFIIATLCLSSVYGFTSTYSQGTANGQSAFFPNRDYGMLNYHTGGLGPGLGRYAYSGPFLESGEGRHGQGEGRGDFGPGPGGFGDGMHMRNPGGSGFEGDEMHERHDDPRHGYDEDYHGYDGEYNAAHYDDYPGNVAAPDSYNAEIYEDAYDGRGFDNPGRDAPGHDSRGFDDAGRYNDGYGGAGMHGNGPGFEGDEIRGGSRGFHGSGLKGGNIENYLVESGAIGPRYSAGAAHDDGAGIDHRADMGSDAAYNSVDVNDARTPQEVVRGTDALPVFDSRAPSDAEYNADDRYGSY